MGRPSPRAEVAVMWKLRTFQVPISMASELPEVAGVVRIQVPEVRASQVKEMALERRCSILVNIVVLHMPRCWKQILGIVRGRWNKMTPVLR